MQIGQAAAVFDEMLEPVTRAFTVDVAKALVNLKANPTAHARIAELAEKCNQGQLTLVEQEEYETYVHVVDLISMLQAKARVWLKRQAGS